MSELRDLIRKVGAEMPQASSLDIAREVFEQTNPDDMPIFYLESLRALVGAVLRADRNTNSGNVGENDVQQLIDAANNRQDEVDQSTSQEVIDGDAAVAMDIAAAAMDLADGTSQPENSLVEDTEDTLSPEPEKPNRDAHQTSRVVDMMRSEKWQGILNSRVYVKHPGVAKQAMLIGDCTAADHRAIADEHRKLGDKHYALATKHDSYAKLIEDCGKTTLFECAEPEPEAA